MCSFLELGCGCNVFGSENSTTCTDWGQCTCKCNVEGDKCDHCSAGYFGLSSVSPTECHGIIQNYKNEFCFHSDSETLTNLFFRMQLPSTGFCK